MLDSNLALKIIRTILDVSLYIFHKCLGKNYNNTYEILCHCMIYYLNITNVLFLKQTVKGQGKVDTL